MTREKILVAFGSVPKDGGTFTFYQNLRPLLLDHGIDLRCISIGRQDADLWEQPYVDDGCVLLAPGISNIKRQSQEFVEWCKREKPDIVKAVNSVAMLSALPHLPEDIRMISRCANGYEHGYRITMSCRERLNRVVALAPGQVPTLINEYGADPDRIVVIPNGTDIARFKNAASRRRGCSTGLKLGFLGRLEHKQKGVLFIPKILNFLQQEGIDFKLKIAGKGMHENVIRSELSSYLENGAVEFLGPLNTNEISGFLADVDVFLFPSQFEGSPNALIEAMMAGCVPAAWKLDGFTDFLIDDGITGFLANLGDFRGLSRKISHLARNRRVLQEMSERVSCLARERFSRDRVVQDYVELFEQVMKEPPMPWKVKNWSEFQVDDAFRSPEWKQWVPEKLKRWIRVSRNQTDVTNRIE